MKPYIIIVAGPPASGKSFYAQKLAQSFNLPLFCKDDIKSALHDAVKFDTSVQQNSAIYSQASNLILLDIAQKCAQAGLSFIIESNLPADFASKLEPLLATHAIVTLLFDADNELLHARFLEREASSERHEGLKAASGAFLSLESFSNACQKSRDFKLGNTLYINTTDFSKINFDALCGKILDFLKS